MESSTEEWRPVLGYEGLYEVSDIGRVRSVDRTVNVRRKGCRHRRKRQGRMLRIGSNRGRPTVGLWKDGKQSVFFVHRLVLEAFVGSRPEGLECCHGDGDHANNRIGNLRWDTHASNEADKDRHGTRPRRENHRSSKLTEHDVREIRRRYAAGEVTQRSLAFEFGVTRANVGHVVRRVTWAG